MRPEPISGLLRRLTIADGAANTSPVVLLSGSPHPRGRPDKLLSMAGRKKGKGTDGTLIGRRRRSVPRGDARHRQALLALVPDPGHSADRNRGAGSGTVPLGSRRSPALHLLHCTIET